MGSGSSAGLQAAIGAASPEDMREVLSRLPPGESAKLVEALRSLPDSDAAAKSKGEYAAAFVPLSGCAKGDWVGTLIDLFSPDDTNPDSRRFVDLEEESGELQVSADTGGERWGRRFDKTTTVNPVLADTDEPAVRKTSFLSKVPEDAPIFAEAQAGALDFTLVLGMAFGRKVIKWNGLYDGKGGDFGGSAVPPSDSDNFWVFT